MTQVVAALAFSAASSQAAPSVATAERQEPFRRDPATAVAGRLHVEAAPTEAGLLAQLREWSRRELREDAVEGFRLESRRTVRDGSRWRFRQMAGGVPLLDGGITVHVAPDGAARLIGQLVPGAQAVAAPAVATGWTDRLDERSLREAGWRRESDAGTTWLARVSGVDRLVVAFDVLEASGPRRGRAFADARSGAFLGVDALGLQAPALVQENDGRDPLTEVQLRGLPVNPTRLRGEYAVAVGADGQSMVRPDGDFRIVPSVPDSTHFDEVAAYHFADRFYREVVGPLGFVPSQVVTLHAHLELFPLTAYTQSGHVYLGREVERYYRDTAKARDLVWHEMTHSMLLDHGIESGGPRREASAIHEGLSDFVAAAATDDPAFGEWVYPAYPGGITRVDSPAAQFHYGAYDQVRFAGVGVGSTWANGMILSGAMWDLRARIGAAALQLVVDALDFCPAVPTFAQFATALLAADESRHGRAHSGAIVGAFRGRGIVGVIQAGIDGPFEVGPGSEATFRAVGDAPEASVWEVLERDRGPDAAPVWREVGRGAQVRLTAERDFELRLRMPTLWDSIATAQRAVSVLRPVVHLVGPDSVFRGETAVFRARAVGAGPFAYTWRTVTPPPASIRTEVHGDMSERVYRPDTDFTLTVFVRDRFGREWSGSRALRVLPPRQPPRLPVAGLRLSQRALSEGGLYEVSLRLAADAPVHVDVIDVRGRRRATLVNDALPAGARLLRWSAAGFEPGRYFLRARSPIGDATWPFTSPPRLDVR